MSLAKYAVAFFRISFSRFSRTFSARSRDRSICSGVTTVAPAPWNVPAAAALTQFRSVYSTNPNSLAAAPAVSPSLTRVTAKSLNSVVYCCFGIFSVLPFMVTAMIRHPWKTKFQGKLNLAGLLCLVLFNTTNKINPEPDKLARRASQASTSPSSNSRVIYTYVLNRMGHGGDSPADHLCL